ncbi:GNAT family N-acetyltransferase [Nocardioides sp. CER19]|uniref:GNAT family N-acetyltransferase n=1 Tax=Nocardioides sp. CER19 TaxID=3038538 RepID=UPI0024491E9F|nr:GNAT family N-acetyltransferase [Nocardioides sp. CER19]MDH2416080.1 GNAT family N-acetyltransferase [Nocardioides sp. CER19]
MEVRVAIADDVDAVIRVGTEAWWATYAPLAGDDYVRSGIERWWSREAIARGIETGRTLVAETDAGVIGMASWSLLEDDDAVMLWKLYVLPEAQGSGAGRGLVHAVVVAAGDRPVRLTHVVGNAGAHGFYERLGFRETGRKPSPIRGGPEEMCMERPATTAP